MQADLSWIFLQILTWAACGTHAFLGPVTTDLCHVAAILSQEIQKALFLNARLALFSLRAMHQT